MLSSERRCRAFVLAAVLGLATACGFEPLHRQGAGASAEALAAIDVLPIGDRSGQLLRAELRSRLGARGTGTAAAWTLAITLSESIADVLLEETSFATRADLQITATARLVRKSDNATLGPSSVMATGSYNVLSAEQEYANVVAEQRAREDAIRLVAQDLALLVSVWLRRAHRDAAQGTGLTDHEN